MSKIIILNGPASVGKDTIGNALAMDYNCIPTSFKRPMFEIAASILGSIEISESFVGSPRLIYITQDAFVSGLKGDCRWEAKRIGKVMNAKATLCDAYAIVNPDGGVVAQFYIK